MPSGRINSAGTSAPEIVEGVLERLIPRPPRFRTASPPGPDGPERVVWVLRKGVATGVAVTLGQSDGRSTEIVAGDLAAGEPVITGTR